MNQITIKCNKQQGMRITPGPGGSLALLRVPVRDTSLSAAHPVRLFAWVRSIANVLRQFL